MSLLRILATFPDPPMVCQWALIDAGSEPHTGESMLADLPQTTGRVELVIPAAHILITRAQLPAAAARRSGSLMAYAAEEKMASEPDGNLASWLGASDAADVLAVMDQSCLQKWRAALAAVGIHDYIICSEILMLPLAPGGWSLAWNGREGFVRTGEFEGVASDCGDRDSPPLSLHLLINEARMRNAPPTAITLYLTAPDALPDVEAWQRELGVPLLSGQLWSWRTALPDAGSSLVRERRRWRLPRGFVERLRPAAAIVGFAFAFHAFALVVDWTRLASEQRALHQQLETRFREAFPDAVAVADPTLQMRRKIAEARHAAHQPDDGDFPMMMAKVAPSLKDLPPAALRILAHENGRMTLEITAIDQDRAQQISTRLLQAGLAVAAVTNPAQNSVTMTVSSP